MLSTGSSTAPTDDTWTAHNATQTDGAAVSAQPPVDPQSLVETDLSIPITTDTDAPEASTPEASTTVAAEIIVAPTDVPWLSQPMTATPRDGFWSLEWRRLVAKRVFDITIASSMLVVLAVPMAIVALIVKLDSRGPAIFRQQRVGVNRRGSGRNEPRLRNDLRLRTERRRRVDHAEGTPAPAWNGVEKRASEGYGRTFTLYKFRTMRTDAEADGRARLATRGDSRITRVGRFLRLTRIDEWPQLFNVLKGEMSLVGPRPERPELVQGLVRDIPAFSRRTNLLPGLTGLAQVEHGYTSETDSFARKAAYDHLYLQTCCLRNDMKILLRTVSVVVTGKGAC